MSDGGAAAAAVDCGAELFEDESGVRVHGWRIRTAARKGILKAEDMDRLEEHLATGHLPEMVHGHNFLECTHEASGVTLRFDAVQALKGWVEEGAAPLEVADAGRWKRSHDLEGVPVVKYDWTYTSCYRGSLLQAAPAAEEGASQFDISLGMPSEVGDGAALVFWTSTTAKVDRKKLAKQDPILFWDEVDLYESELDDNGVARMNLKVRVMPSSWYVLMRFWLRVDGVLMRIRDTRVYCPFDAAGDAPLVLREVLDKEGSLEAGAGLKLPSDALGDPNIAQLMLPTCKEVTEALQIEAKS